MLTPVCMVMWMGTDIPIDIEFQGTSFERFRMHVLPLLLLYSAIAIGTFMGARDNGKGSYE